MKIILTNWQLLAIAIIINIIITSIGVFLSNLNFLRTNNLLNRTEETSASQHQFEVLQLSHERTTRDIKNATNIAGVVLTEMNETQENMVETQKNIAQLTNDIYIMQKSELESRKALGQFLAIVAANNNITIPEELRKQLLISNAAPELSAPPNY